MKVNSLRSTGIALALLVVMGCSDDIQTNNSSGTTANVAPEVQSSANDITIEAYDSIADITITATDDFTDAGNLSFSVDSTNQDILPLSQVSLTGSGGSRTLRLEPVGGVVGTGSVFVFVTDRDGLTNPFEIKYVVTNKTIAYKDFVRFVFALEANGTPINLDAIDIEDLTDNSDDFDDLFQ